MGGVWGRRGATQTQRVERVEEHSASRTTCLLLFSVGVVVTTAALAQLFIGAGRAEDPGPERRGAARPEALFPGGAANSAALRWNSTRTWKTLIFLLALERNFFFKKTCWLNFSFYESSFLVQLSPPVMYG